MPFKPNPDIFGPATLAVTQGITAFNVFLPKLSEVRRADLIADPDIAGDVRMGEIAAVTVTMGMGLIASSLTGSSIPTLSGLIISSVLVCIYEGALRNHKPLNPKPLGGNDNG